jgi:hypothetical protein
MYHGPNKLWYKRDNWEITQISSSATDEVGFSGEHFSDENLMHVYCPLRIEPWQAYGYKSM